MTAYCETPGKCKNLSIEGKETFNEYGWCKKYQRRIKGRQPFIQLNKCTHDKGKD